MTLDELRGNLDSIDRNILQLIADRQATVGEMARFKQSSGSPLRDFRREREVLTGAAENAAALGLSPEFAQSVMRLLIRYSLTLQERAGMSADGRGTGRRALVIGGGGKMGGWFVQFLHSQGFSVDIHDLNAPAGVPVVADWKQHKDEYEFIVVATPLGATNDMLLELAQVRPSGVVFDVASLKSPLRSGLQALRDAGVLATSLHPMFGPDVDLLAGRRVVFVDTGSPVALQRAMDLFSTTMVAKVELGIDEHDRLMAFVLGLPHALNIVFFTALQRGGDSASRLMEVAGTTFSSQFGLSRSVAQESASLYYEIQKLNAFGGESLAAFSSSLAALMESVSSDTAGEFTALMEAGRRFTTERRQRGVQRTTGS